MSLSVLPGNCAAIIDHLFHTKPLELIFFFFLKTQTLIKMKRFEIRDLIEEKKLPASNTKIETTNDSIFFFGETSMLDVRTEIIQPSQSTTFSTSL